MSAFSTKRENDIAKLKRKEGWVAFRTSLGKGGADVIALKEIRPNSLASRVQFIECKATIGPYDHFGPAARREFLAVARAAGAEAYLAWWPKDGKLVWIPWYDWPERKAA